MAKGKHLMEFKQYGFFAIDMYRNFEKFKSALSQGSTVIMDKIGDEAIKEMRERTAAGKDVRGNAFAPYTPEYAAHKLKLVGRNSPVDMNLWGHMLAAIQKETTSKICRVFIAKTWPGDKTEGGPWTKARVHNYGGLSGRRGKEFRQKKREFFGVSTGKLNELKEMFKEYWRTVFRRIMSK